MNNPDLNADQSFDQCKLLAGVTNQSWSVCFFSDMRPQPSIIMSLLVVKYILVGEIRVCGKYVQNVRFFVLYNKQMRHKHCSVASSYSYIEMHASDSIKTFCNAVGCICHVSLRIACFSRSLFRFAVLQYDVQVSIFCGGRRSDHAISRA